MFDGTGRWNSTALNFLQFLIYFVYLTFDIRVCIKKWDLYHQVSFKPKP